MRNLVNVLSKLRKLQRKSYRDGYLQTQVRSGIAYQLQAIRRKFNYSQEAFAEVVGKKQSVISRLESTAYGRVSVQTLLDIATATNVALVVRFVSYPDFLALTSNMTVEGLQPETIDESLAEIEQVAHKNSSDKYLATIWGPAPLDLNKHAPLGRTQFGYSSDNEEHPSNDGAYNTRLPSISQASNDHLSGLGMARVA